MTNASKSTKDNAYDRFVGRIADVPWGLIALVVIGILDASHDISSDDVKAFASAAGLFGLGHGIHTGAKHFAKG
jgi:hypothetical protein